MTNPTRKNADGIRHYNAMDPQPVSRVDEAHEELFEAIEHTAKNYGPEDTAEALAGCLVMSESLDAELVRDRLNHHLELGDAIKSAGIESGRDSGDGNDWDELQVADRCGGFADDLGGRFPDEDGYE